MLPGEAMNSTMAVLRHNGYGSDNVRAFNSEDGIQVIGTLYTLEEPMKDLGSFRAVWKSEDDFVVRSGSFGAITQDGIDVFDDL